MEDDFVDYIEKVVVGVAYDVSVEAVDNEIVPRVGLGDHVSAVDHFVICKGSFESGLKLFDIDVVLNMVALHGVVDR